MVLCLNEVMDVFIAWYLAKYSDIFTFTFTSSDLRTLKFPYHYESIICITALRIFAVQQLTTESAAVG